MGELTPFEARLVDAAGEPGSLPDASLDGAEAWLWVLASASCEVAARLRARRFGSLRREVTFKEDHSPVTALEQRVEEKLRERIAAFDAAATVVGEEHGGEVAATGISIAIDPVDGTWALLNRTAGFGISIAALRDGEPWLGLVLQPATGELTYGASDRPTRLLQLPIFGEAPRAYDLPLEPVTAHGVLVDLHPNRGHGPLSTVLNAAWRGNTLHMVRSSGGSPTVALAEAARGRFIYVNRWSGRAASPYDLAAGALLLEGAGGCLRTPSGREVDPLRHRGPLVAGVDHAAVDKICALLGGGLESLPEPRPGPGDG